MAAIHFTVHVDASLPSAVQASISQAIRQHVTATLGQQSGPVTAAALAAQAVQELLQAAGVAGAAAAARRAAATPPPEVELPPGVGRRDCAICLDEIEPGQGCCRPPCLHIFHGACLRKWLRQNPTCPVCKLCLAAPRAPVGRQPAAAGPGPPPAGGDAGAEGEPVRAGGPAAAGDGEGEGASGGGGETRQLRFRLAELSGLTARELRYVAGYLGIAVERGAERPELELTVLGSPSVRILTCREELLALAVGRLQALLRSVGVQQSVGLAEKADLVGALFGSGRFLREEGAAHDEERALAQPAAGGSASSVDPALADGQAGPLRSRSGTQARRPAPY